MSLMESGTGMCRDSGTVKPLRGLAGCRGLDGGGAPSRASGLSGDLQWTGSARAGREDRHNSRTPPRLTQAAARSARKGASVRIRSACSQQ